MKYSCFALLLLFFITLHTAPNIAVIGTGYVGLVTGPGLAEFGNQVTCADIDQNKIERLQQGEIPIYEPGLEELVQHNVQQNRLKFTHDVGAAIEEADIIFIAVGTPMGSDGNADLKYVQSVLKTISEHMNGFKIIVIKSTVPVGTGRWASYVLQNLGVQPDQFTMVSNPEFLREGSSVPDFLKPDRIVIGAESEQAHTTMNEIYSYAFAHDAQQINTNIETSELIKYASNAFLAVKLSFINEIANICDATGAQVDTVAHAMGMDHRISDKFLNPGPGFGGSCFPKDSQALICLAQKNGIHVPVVQASLTTNQIQKVKPIEKLKELLRAKKLNAKTVAVLGLAFKANTDDIRYSPSIDVIRILLEEYAQVKAYDPKAMDNMKHEMPNINYCDSIAEAVKDVDGVIIMTEWPEFKDLLDYIKYKKNKPVIVDTRNILDTKELKNAGFTYATMGNGTNQN
ncbi:MAG: UDP-glucose/GDP-mannose dehydrogenase family protein [Candidatus Dependentiae bacterium]